MVRMRITIVKYVQYFLSLYSKVTAIHDVDIDLNEKKPQTKIN